MEVFFGGRMGGPEVGAKFHASVVLLRPVLKASLADLFVEGVATLDIEMFIGGSITDYCPEGFDSSSKYGVKKRELKLSICVPRREAELVGENELDLAVARWLICGCKNAKLPRSAASVNFDLIVDAIRQGVSH